MSKSKTNRYRSGAKRPEQEVLVTPLDNGQYAVSILDAKNLRLIHEVIGSEHLDAKKGGEK